MSTSGKDAFERVRQQVVKIPLHSNDTMTRYSCGFILICNKRSKDRFVKT